MLRHKKNLPITMRFVFALLLIWSTNSFGQEPPSNVSNWNSLNELLATNLKFPSEELRDGKSARVIISMKINELGRPDSIFLIESASELFNVEVLRVIDLATANWKPEFLENRPVGNEYLWVISFVASVEETMFSDEFQVVDNLIKREKFEKAIEFCTEKITANPYQYKWYEKRAEIHRLAGITASGQRDFMAAKQIKRKVLAEAELKAFGINRVNPGIPGTIRGTNF